MWVYLLGFAVLIMIFLIAILTDTYSYYTGVANALHIKEMIKLRVIFEEDRHYQWLAKTPNLINFHMLIFAPIVIFFKSRKLNSFLIRYIFINWNLFIIFKNRKWIFIFTLMCCVVVCYPSYPSLSPPYHPPSYPFQTSSQAH